MSVMVWPLAEDEGMRGRNTTALAHSVPARSGKGTRGSSLLTALGRRGGGARIDLINYGGATLRALIWTLRRLASRSGWQ